MFIIVMIFLFLLGIIVGSFINVLVYRTHEKKSIIKGRSICPDCKKQLKGRDLIPIFSYVALKGKCRYCKKPISAQYPLVEIATGTIFVSFFYFFNPHEITQWLSLSLWIFVSIFLIAAFIYDTKWQILPDKFLIPAIIISLIYILILSIFFDQYHFLYNLLGAFVFALFFLALWFISKGKWIGDGDIRLAFLMGVLLSPMNLILAIFFGSSIASLVSLFLILVKKKKATQKIAFGPYLIIGLYISLFFAQQIINWYLRLFGI